MLGAAGVATVGIAGVASAFKGSYRGTRKLALGQAPKPRAHASSTHATTHHHHHGSHASHVPPGAHRLGSSAQLPAGQAATYTDPGDGHPDIVIRGSDGKLVAFSAVCTHAGCTVGYSGGEIVCPCHGGTYSAETGAVTGGPPPQGLARKRVIESGGEMYAVPS
jgi:nitrite reductase/ring-hydroxylating ferredoxin subunit